MPLKPGRSAKVVSDNIREFRKGKTFAKTARTHGRSRAQKQAIAVALAEARKAKR